MFLVHRRDIVEPVEVRQRLQVRFVLDQLFRAPVQKSDMRIDALDDLAIELDYEPQDTVGRRVLGPKIDGEIANSGFGHGGPRVGSTPPVSRCSIAIGEQDWFNRLFRMPSQRGDRPYSKAWK